MYFDNIIFFIGFTSLFQTSEPSYRTTTLSVFERVALLKGQIERQIAGIDDSFIREFDDDDKFEPITPIMNAHKSKKHPRSRPLRTTTFKPLETKPEENNLKKIARNANVTDAKADIDTDSKENSTVKQQKTKRVHSNLEPQYKDVFYRRVFPNIIKNHDHWAHCQDLITPFFLGHKTNFQERKILVHDDFVIRRLIQLLDDVTEEMSKDDIYSLMYQISMLQLRLFQWEPVAIMNLLLTITKEHKERMTFRILKKGLKGLLDKWHMDFSNTTNLALQSLIFRPPCVFVTKYEGSTLSPKVTKYTSTTTEKCKKKKTEYGDEEEEN